MDKMKKTNRKKYGVDFVLSNKEITSKRLKTNELKYGGPSPMASETIKNKIKKTTQEKYGVDHIFQSQEIKEKIKLFYQNNYKVSNNNHVDYINEKRKETNKKKYGAETPFASPEIQKKVKDTIRKKYNRNHINQKHIDLNVINITKNDLEQLNEKYNIDQISSMLNVSYDWVIKKLRLYNLKTNIHSRLSKVEQSIKILFETNNIDFFQNNRSVIYPYELDFLTKTIAVEVNGSYWHSELNGKSKYYHLNKSLKCELNKIQLIHIWEHEYFQKKEILNSLLLSKFGFFNERIYARKCIIKEVDHKTKNTFLFENHLQGFCSSYINLGLYYENSLKAIMTFGKPRFNKKYEYELLRFCNKIDLQVLGGASKLLSAFIDRYKPESIISYSDRRYSIGNMYKNLGFNFVEHTPPNFWVTKNYVDFYNRVAFQKHKLDSILKSFDKSKTAWDNLKDNGYDRIWDCGSSKWIMKF